MLENGFLSFVTSSISGKHLKLSSQNIKMVITDTLGWMRFPAFFTYSFKWMRLPYVPEAVSVSTALAVVYRF